jgi:apolipoprotein N-acyltransferase
VVSRNGKHRERSGGLRLAILAGLLLWLACPPVTLWPLAYVALVPLIVSVTRARNFFQAAWRGYVFGWVFLGPVWYWVGLTIVAWTKGSPIGWAAWFGLTLILAGFYAAWSGAAWWLARRTSGGVRVLALAAAWVIMEWARTLGSLSMPWAQIELHAVSLSARLQFADLTGAYGVSFLLMLINGAIALWWMERDEPNRIRRLRGLFAAVTLMTFACFYGALRLTQPKTGPTLPVAVMQGNINNRIQPDARLYTDLTKPRSTRIAIRLRR